MTAAMRIADEHRPDSVFVLARNEMAQPLGAVPVGDRGISFAQRVGRLRRLPLFQHNLPVSGIGVELFDPNRDAGDFRRRIAGNFFELPVKD